MAGEQPLLPPKDGQQQQQQQQQPEPQAQPKPKPAGAQQAKEPQQAAIEVSFSLAWGAEEPVPLTLRGTRSRVTIGRSPECDLQIPVTSVSYVHCELFLKRKNRDALLCVRDLSKNHTGVRHASADLTSHRPWHELQLNGQEVLGHQSQLLVPMRQRRTGVPGEDRRTPVTVLFALPDAYCAWKKHGRWLYFEKLGEGGLAVVYRARDMRGGLGEVAVKVSKFFNLPPASTQNRHVYALHREARWSLERLHNPADGRHCPEGGALFVRYLEDHTGFASHGPKDFDEVRWHFEDPAFSWGTHKFSPPLAQQPYIVMELVPGKLLQNAIEGDPPLNEAEKRSIVRGCCESLVYMERFGVIHRDFRGCNIFLKDRGPECSLKVIDLGFMISAEPRQASNPNPAVRCAWQGDPARKLRFDWAPPEVRGKGCPNFAQPACCFDIFSMGVLILKLLRGRTWTQEALQIEGGLKQLDGSDAEIEGLRLSKSLLLRMLDHEKPSQRPVPKAVLRVVMGEPLTAAAAVRAATAKPGPPVPPSASADPEAAAIDLVVTHGSQPKRPPPQPAEAAASGRPPPAQRPPAVPVTPGPAPTPTPPPPPADGFPAFTPEDYVPIFREAGIGLIVRLNKKQYERRRFIDHGIKHVDLYFLDGSCPSRDIISKFLHITESEPGAVAVHCKAGLGRTGTLIGLYAMKHFQFPARAFIGWNRICRPGSILGPQQQFLLDMQNDMFQAGAALRRPVAPPSLAGEAQLAHRLDGLSLRQAEQYEDAGQGERLCNAKRNVRTPNLGGGGSAPPLTETLPPVARHPVPHREATGSNPDLARVAVVREQRPAVSMIRRSLRGVFSR